METRLFVGGTSHGACLLETLISINSWIDSASTGLLFKKVELEASFPWDLLLKQIKVIPVKRRVWWQFNLVHWYIGKCACMGDSEHSLFWWVDTSPSLGFSKREDLAHWEGVSEGRSPKPTDWKHEAFGEKSVLTRGARCWANAGGICFSRAKNLLFLSRAKWNFVCLWPWAFGVVGKSGGSWWQMWFDGPFTSSRLGTCEYLMVTSSRFWCSFRVLKISWKKMMF